MAIFWPQVHNNITDPHVDQMNSDLKPSAIRLFEPSITIELENGCLWQDFDRNSPRRPEELPLALDIIKELLLRARFRIRMKCVNTRTRWRTKHLLRRSGEPVIARRSLHDGLQKTAQPALQFCPTMLDVNGTCVGLEQISEYLWRFDARKWVPVIELAAVLLFQLSILVEA